MTVTANQINACDDTLLLLDCCTGATGEQPLAGRTHWGDNFALPWQYWRELLRWFLENEHFVEWPYRICGLDLSQFDPPTEADITAVRLEIAADTLGGQLSLTRGGSETLIAWARRGLCAKLGAEQT